MYNITSGRMANFDETNVEFAVKSNTTIAYRGQRTVTAWIPSSSGRCTVMLGVSGNGKKFPPYIIWKGKPGARIQKDLKKAIDHGYSHGCVYTVQPKAWMDEQRMLDWVEKVWKPWTLQFHGKPTILILDEMSAHLCPSVRRAAEACGSLVEYVPRGYTSTLQVMDIGLNKPLKDYIRRIANEWMTVPGNEKGIPSRQNVSSWIVHAWENISEETIINSWAHINLVEWATNKQEDNVEDRNDEEGEAPIQMRLVEDGSPMWNNDPRGTDFLALHSSDETSDSEEENQ
jgi:hypothetical protein